MQALLQRVEVQAVGRRDHDLAVDDAAGRQRRDQPLAQLGKIAVERLEVAALDVEVVGAAEDEGAEAVPLRFVQRSPAPRAAAAAALASIGSIGGAMAKPGVMATE